MLCASKGNDEIMKILINAGANVEVRDRAGLTVMHYACKSQNVNTVGYMLQEGKIFGELHDARTRGGVTPLMYVVQGTGKYVSQLTAECLNTGMHPFVEDYLGNSVMDYAALHKEEKNPNVCDGIKMAQD